MKKENDRKWIAIEYTGWLLCYFIIHTEIFQRFPYNSGILRYNIITPQFMWALAAAWIIFACHQLKSGWLIRSFLSHVFWQPLSKLCLGVYIIHFIYICRTHYQAGFSTFLDKSLSTVLHVAYGDIFISFLIAAAFNVLVEIPLATLTNFVIGYEVEEDKKRKVKKEECLPLLE